MARPLDLTEVAPPVKRRSSNLPTLTGMRGIAAFFVFGFHATYVYFFSDPGVQSGWETFFRQGGYASVGFFFVLSGFVLTWSAQSTDTAGSFWRRRFFKVWPNHLLTFVAAAMFIGWVDQTPVNWLNGLYNVLLVQSWFPQIEIRTAFNGPAWSLSCEMLFYLSFPLVLRWINKIRPERLWAWAGGVVAAVFGVAVVALILPSGPYFELSRNYETEFYLIYQLPATRMLDFVLGIILARIVITKRKLPFGLRGAVAVAVAAYLFGSVVEGAFSYVAIMFVPIGLLVLAAAKADLDGRTSWLSSRFMVWTGELSFAFYLWHVMTMYYGHRWLGGGEGKGFLVAMAEIVLLYAITLAAAWATFVWFERPIMRRFGARRPPSVRDPSVHSPSAPGR